MEDKKLDIKLNKENIPSKKDLPVVPRKEDGTIDIDKIIIGKDDKGRIIVPDEILEAYYKELPNGTTNKSSDKWVYNGGILNKVTKEVQLQGNEALKSKYAQRRSFKEAIETVLCQKARANDIEELELSADATNLDVIIASALKQSVHGNVKAMDFLRDTVGEKPTDKLSAEVTALTPEDKEMLENISNRISGNI